MNEENTNLEILELIAESEISSYIKNLLIKNKEPLDDKIEKIHIFYKRITQYIDGMVISSILADESIQEDKKITLIRKYVEDAAKALDEVKEAITSLEPDLK